MHSSRMRTVRCSSRLPGGYLSAREVCLPKGVYTSPLWTDRHLSKHNLSATTVADGKKAKSLCCTKVKATTNCKTFLLRTKVGRIVCDQHYTCRLLGTQLEICHLGELAHVHYQLWYLHIFRKRQGKRYVFLKVKSPSKLNKK